MSFNSGANVNLVQTRLDSIVREEFDHPNEPNEVTALTTTFFKQEPFDKGSYVHEEIGGPGAFRDHAEEEEVDQATPRSGNLVTTRIRAYKRDIPIPDEMMEDNQLGTVDYEVRQLASNAKLSRDDFAFRQSYGDAFSGSLTPDGDALCSNSHTTLSNDTVDNLETGSLTAANLEVVVRSVRRQRKQDGMLGGHNAAGLLTAVNPAEGAMEITKSKLKSGTPDNTLNYFSEVYPGLVVGTSAYLHSDYNAGLNTNVNTSYFVVSRHHQITRIQRKTLTTKLVPPDTDRKYRKFYRAKFREVIFAKSWSGICGSNGTA